MNTHPSNTLAVLLWFTLLLSGCVKATPTVLPSPSATAAPPTYTAVPPASPTATRTTIPSPTLTLTLSPTPTPLPTATATPPLNPLSGSGWKIAYASYEKFDWHIYTMNADGSGKKRITAGVKGGYEPAWSPDGRKIVFQYNGLWIADLAGGEIIRLALDTGSLENEYLTKPAWSPDGQWIAFNNESGVLGDIYRVKPDGSDLRRLTDSGDVSRDASLVWSPDSSQIAFSADREGNIGIYLLFINNTPQGPEAGYQANLTGGRLNKKGARDLVFSWSAVDNLLAFATNWSGSLEIYLLHQYYGDSYRLTDNPADDTEPAWSPDGKWIAFSSNRSGNFDIYLINVEAALQNPGGAYAWQLTNAIGDDVGPVWMAGTP